MFEEPLYLGFKKKTRVMMPESYDEMTGEQFTALVSYSKGWISEDEFMLQFLGIERKLLDKLDRWTIYNINRLLDFLKDMKPTDKMYIGSIPAKVDGQIIRLTAPGAKLSGMTFQQFMTVDTFFGWWVYSEKTPYLYNFITTLFTDPSKPFAELETEKYKEGILSMDGNTRDMMEAAVVNWMMIKQWLSNSYPYLFPTPPSDGKEEKPKKKKKPGSWLEIFDSLVDEDLTRVETYQTLPAMDVIRILNGKIKNAKKRK